MGRYYWVTLIVAVGWFVSLPLLSGATGLVNINTADSATLQTLNSIGEAKAADIIAYREAHGPFASIEDIMKVSGIKDATFAKIKDFITVVGENPPLLDATSTTTPDQAPNATTTPTDTEIGSGPVSISGGGAYSSTAALSPGAVPVPLEISAGRQRLVAINTPVLFRALVVKPKQSPMGLTWHWSFGDATESLGEQVSHTYRFPGRYLVVLNASHGNELAVAETWVEVIKPELTLAVQSAGVEPFFQVTNHSKKEINLGGWQLQTDQQPFVFPVDTILTPGQSLALDPDLTGAPLLARRAGLYYPNQRPALTLSLASQRAVALSQMSAELAALSRQVQALRSSSSSRLVTATRPAVPSLSVATTTPPLVLATTSAPRKRVVTLPRAPNFWDQTAGLVRRAFSH